MDTTECQCLHFLDSLYSLTSCNTVACPALRFSTKWAVSAGSVGGVWFLPRGKKVRTDRYASVSFLHAELHCRNFIRLKRNKIPVVELIL